MTLLTALDMANKVRPNAAHDDIKIKLLFQQLEGNVAEMAGLDPPGEAYEYDAADPDDVELLMPFPYDDIYLWFLCAQIDLMNEETALYEDDMAMFNFSWQRAQAWFRRNKKTLRKNNWRVM